MTGTHDGAKTPYETPRLLRFGDVSELTKAVGGTGMNDGGTNPKNKTGL